MTGLNTMPHKLGASTGDQHIIFSVFCVCFVIQKSEVNKLTNKLNRSTRVLCKLTDTVCTPFRNVGGSQNLVQHLVRNGCRYRVNGATSLKIVKMLTNNLERHVVVALHRQDIPQALDVGLGVLSIPSIGTFGVDQTTLLQKTNLRSADPRKIKIQLT